MTATPEQLQGMLYDGAIRFCEQAKAALLEKDVPATHDRLLRAQRIIVELSGSLKTSIDPELCARLASLYNYVYRLLVDANMNKDAGKIDEALELLHYQRDTWNLLMGKLREETEPAEPADVVDAPAPEAPAPDAAGSLIGGRLSLEG